MIRTINQTSDTLTIDDGDRYDRLRLIQWWDQSRIAAAKVMVVGAGALGNEVLKNLVLLGLGEIHIVDFDSVQPSNLSRSVLFREKHTGQSKACVSKPARLGSTVEFKKSMAWRKCFALLMARVTNVE